MPTRAAYVLSFAALVALGIARFSYALVLPSMRSDLGLTYGAAGSLGTANTAGYLLGSLLLPAIVARWRLVPVFRAGVIGTAIAIVATGVSHAYPVILAARAAAGLAGSAAFILGSALAASVQTRGADAVVVFNGGAGAGVVLAGLALPGLLDGHPGRWPIAWFGLGAVAVVAALAVSAERWVAPPVAPVRPSLRMALTEAPSLHWLTIAYACFGAAYIVYVTFLISTLRSNGASGALTSVAFVTLGAMTIGSPRIWRRALRTWTPRRLVAATMALQSTAAALLLVHGSTVAILLSVVVFGVAFLLTPALVTMTVRDHRPPASWASAIGAVTAVFAATQAVSPWISGVLIDRYGTGAGPVWTMVFSALGAACAIAVRS